MALVQIAPGAPTPGLAVLKVSNSVFTRERTKNSPKSKTLFQHVLLETLGQKAPGAPTLVSAAPKVPNSVFPLATAPCGLGPDSSRGANIRFGCPESFQLRLYARKDEEFPKK